MWKVPEVVRLRDVVEVFLVWLVRRRFLLVWMGGGARCGSMAVKGGGGIGIVSCCEVVAAALFDVPERRRVLIRRHAVLFIVFIKMLVGRSPMERTEFQQPL